MYLDAVFERFAQKSPVTVMTRTLMENALRTLTPHFEHKLFLSAPPHNGYTESFAALLELLDDQRFHRGVTPDATQLAAIMVRRMKSELPPDDLGRARFASRHLEALEVDFPDDERRAHEDLGRRPPRLRLPRAWPRPPPRRPRSSPQRRAWSPSSGKRTEPKGKR